MSTRNRQVMVSEVLRRQTACPDLDEDLVEYRCDACNERCINPRDSDPSREALCVRCMASLLTTGSTAESHFRRTYR